MATLSSYCSGHCEINREAIDFVGFRQVRYEQGMRACYKCQLAWITNQKFCHCCKSQMRFKRRAKKSYE